MSRFLDILRKQYPLPAYAVFAEVRSATGAVDGPRYGDYVVVALLPSGRGQIILLEEKASKGDYGREIRAPEKSEEIGRFCTERYFIVQAPRKNVIPDLDRVPHPWGLLEVGAGGIVEVREAVKVEPACEPSAGFMRSLLRAAVVQGEAGSGEHESTIGRHLGGNRYALGCGHSATIGVKASKMPKKWPCLHCAAGDKTDEEIVEAAIDDAEPEQLRRWAEKIERMRGGA
jgi:hypothetical protein